MTRKQRRLALIGTALAVLGLAAALVLNALKDSIVFFNSPTDVVEKPTKPGTRIRIGGLVKPGTLVHGQAPDTLTVHFDVTDGNKDVPVAYTGALPDLFREGQGVVAEGTLQELRERASGEDKDATLEDIFLNVVGVHEESHNLSWLE